MPQGGMELNHSDPLDIKPINTISFVMGLNCRPGPFGTTCPKSCIGLPSLATAVVEEKFGGMLNAMKQLRAPMVGAPGLIAL